MFVVVVALALHVAMPPQKLFFTYIGIIHFIVVAATSIESDRNVSIYCVLSQQIDFYVYKQQTHIFTAAMGQMQSAPHFDIFHLI